ncbi:SAV_6107 family HEPN domain-containing protein [Enemella evansiae]|uniref:SAV_6107 family HEPN domain-containing protein n=1 Tax=Enemella evansiae TaxID=2016499 RepID=UPI000B960019|nr:SAV_6107 family HEPN domain-containing protein [Enemella evansiae]OYO18294.1 hypothetical protein BI335_08010 [Enemella evansiae]TDO93776.1 hypothetical protein C8D81_1570 [Enemella evansiae]
MTDASSELARARATLVQAELTTPAADRYLTAHRAAGQVAAVVLAMRCRPGRQPARRNAWGLLAEVAPELAEWAGFFLALQGKCEVLRAGASNLVSAREADDLVREAAAFHDQVTGRLVGDRRSGVTPDSSVHA